MLSDEHQDPKMQVRYGSLQLHVILARWLGAKMVAGREKLTPIEILKIRRVSDDRKLKLSDKVAKAVRDLR